MCTLESFTLNHGEDMEDALSRAITLHLHDTPFTAILRRVHYLLLEREMEMMKLHSAARDCIHRLIELSRPAREPIRLRIQHSLERASIRKRVAHMLNDYQQDLLRKLEHYALHQLLTAPPLATAAHE